MKIIGNISVLTFATIVVSNVAMAEGEITTTTAGSETTSGKIISTTRSETSAITTTGAEFTPDDEVIDATPVELEAEASTVIATETAAITGAGNASEGKATNAATTASSATAAENIAAETTAAADGDAATDGAVMTEGAKLSEKLADTAVVVNIEIDSCYADAAIFCPGLPLNSKKSFACLMAYEDNLSMACKVGIVEAAFAVEMSMLALEYSIDACEADADKYCLDVEPGEGRIVSCLKKNESNLKTECTSALKETGLWNIGTK